MKKILPLAMLVTACADDPDNITYILNADQDTQCSAACERLFECDPKEGYSAASCTKFCLEYNIPSVAPDWFPCVLERPCTGRLRQECSQYVNGKYE